MRSSVFVIFSGDLLLARAITAIIFSAPEQNIKIKEKGQKLFNEPKEKIYELTNKLQGIQDVKVAELIPAPQKTKQHKYQKRYIQNQMNKIYRKHNKIFLNRIKHK